MSTYNRRARYHGDRPMQMLALLIVSSGAVLFCALVGIAVADWMTDYDTLGTVARCAMEAR